MPNTNTTTQSDTEEIKTLVSELEDAGWQTIDRTSTSVVLSFPFPAESAEIASFTSKEKP